MNYRRYEDPFARRKTSVAEALKLAEDGRTAHLSEDADGVVSVSDGQEVSPLERLLLDMVAEVRWNLSRLSCPVPDLRFTYIFDHYHQAAVRMQALCSMYEVLTQRVGAEGLHLAVSVAAETASGRQRELIAKWLDRSAPELPDDRQVRDWPVTTFSPVEDDALASLRARSPQLEDVTFTDAPRTDVGDTIAGFDPEQSIPALTELAEVTAIAQTVGGTILLVGPKRMVAVNDNEVVKMRREHTPATKAAYKVLRTRYGKYIRIKAGIASSLHEHDVEDLNVKI